MSPFSPAIVLAMVTSLACGTSDSSGRVTSSQPTPAGGAANAGGGSATSAGGASTEAGGGSPTGGAPAAGGSSGNAGSASGGGAQGGAAGVGGCTGAHVCGTECCPANQACHYEGSVPSCVHDCAYAENCPNGCCAPALGADGKPNGARVCKPADGAKYNCCDTVACDFACCIANSNGSKVREPICTTDAACGKATCIPIPEGTCFPEQSSESRCHL